MSERTLILSLRFGVQTLQVAIKVHHNTVHCACDGDGDVTACRESNQSSSKTMHCANSCDIYSHSMGLFSSCVREALCFFLCAHAEASPA